MKDAGQPKADHAADRELVRRLLAGDEEAFETFGERSFRALYRFALARLDGDRELAREITQTTLVKVLPKLATYRGEAALSTWLCSCCLNEIRMHRRRQGGAPQRQELTEGVEPATGVVDARPPGPEAALARRREAERVHLALDALPEHYARALEWKYLESLPVRQIARRLELRPKAAESLLTRARRAFRETYAALRDGVPAAGGDGEEDQHGRAKERGRAPQPA